MASTNGLDGYLSTEAHRQGRVLSRGYGEIRTSKRIAPSRTALSIKPKPAPAELQEELIPKKDAPITSQKRRPPILPLGLCRRWLKREIWPERGRICLLGSRQLRGLSTCGRERGMSNFAAAHAPTIIYEGKIMWHLLTLLRHPAAPSSLPSIRSLSRSAQICTRRQDSTAGRFSQEQIALALRLPTNHVKRGFRTMALFNLDKRNVVTSHTKDSSLQIAIHFSLARMPATVYLCAMPRLRYFAQSSVCSQRNSGSWSRL